MQKAYKKTVDYLYSQLPVYQKIGEKAVKVSLKNAELLDTYLNYPHRHFKSVHVGGTNGKGSTSYMIASVLQTAGYRVGLYTSPHLTDFRERIKINGKNISKKYVTDFVTKHKSFFSKIKPSFFEITVALAFDYFANRKVDIAIIEVGLGGRLDSTNIINPILSVITNIGYDHTNFLGQSLKEIAIEKAGIIKHEVPVIVSELQEETKNIFIEKSKIKKSTINFADQIYTLKTNEFNNFYSYDIYKNQTLILSDLKLDLIGHYQAKNLKGTICALEILKSSGFKINCKNIYNGLSSVISRTGLKGRWQMINRKPLVILDIAHNKEGLQAIFKQVKKIKFNSMHIIFGLSDGKDIKKIMDLLPKKAIYYLVKSKVIRGISTSILADYAQKNKLSFGIFNSVKEGYKQALENSKENDMLLITGSTFVVSEVI